MNTLEADGTMKRTETHVVPGRSGGWEVVRPGASKRDSQHPTKEEAAQRAREIVRERGGGEVVVHGRDGRIQDSDTITAKTGSGRDH